MTPPRMLRIVPFGDSPHFLEIEFLHPRFVGRDGRAFDADADGLDRLGGIDRHLVVGRVAVLDREIEILEVDVEIGMDQLVPDQVPDDARHLVAVEFDDRIGDLDLGHLAKDFLGGRRAACGRRTPIASALRRAKTCAGRAGLAWPICAESQARRSPLLRSFWPERRDGSRRRRSRNRQRGRDPMRDRRSVRQGGGAAARFLHQAHLAGELVPAHRGQPRRSARSRPVHAGDRERARAPRSVRSRIRDPSFREVLERTQASVRQSGSGGGCL